MERQMSLFEESFVGKEVAKFEEKYKKDFNEYFKRAGDVYVNVKPIPVEFAESGTKTKEEIIDNVLSQFKIPNPLEPKFFGSDYVPKEDDKRLTGNIEKVFSLMKDGGWRTLQEIERSTGVPAASVSANLRHLKREVYGSHNLTKRIRGERSGGLWEYKIIINK